jgi:NAD(P)-dependent dehydrogenase (short-subunit alcohol dehydrogenase family)
MTGTLEGKVIIVAGCGGIGDELVRFYAQDGAKAVAGDVRGDHASQLAQALDPTGKRVVGVALDGADESSVKETVALAQSHFGRLTGIHANFVYSIVGDDTVEDVRFDEFNTAMRVNAGGYLLCSRHAIPAMLNAGGGSIVYTATSDT